MKLAIVILALAAIIIVGVGIYSAFQSPVATAQADVMRLEAIDQLQDSAQARAQKNLEFALEYQNKVRAQQKEIEDQARNEQLGSMFGGAVVVVVSAVWMLAIFAAVSFFFAKLTGRI